MNEPQSVEGNKRTRPLRKQRRIVQSSLSNLFQNSDSIVAIIDAKYSVNVKPRLQRCLSLIFEEEDSCCSDEDDCGCAESDEED